MSDQLGVLIEAIVKQDADDGYNDDPLLVLLILKKILAQNQESFGAQDTLTQQQENTLISVCIIS